MKGIIFIRKVNLEANTFKLPFLGQGHFTNISVTAWIQNPLTKRILFHMGKDGSDRMVIPVVNIADVLEVSNDYNWTFLLNYPQTDVVGDDPSKYSIVFAHRKRPLKVRFGDPLNVIIVGEDTPDVRLIVIRYEFIPYYQSRCAWGMMYKIVTPTSENFSKKIIIPMSIREGLITYKITSIGGVAAEDSGYVIPNWQRAGSQDEAQSAVSTGYGVIDTSMDTLGEVLALGSTLQDMIPVNSPGAGASNQKTFSKEAIRTGEGSTLSFDFLNIAGAITGVFLFIRIDFLPLYNRYRHKGSFLDGTRVVQLNERRIASI